MPSNSTALASRPSTTRSRITNGSRLLRGIDGRSASARRFRDLVDSFVSELGGIDKVGESEKATIRQAASLTLRCESLQADLVNGLPVDDEQMVRLANVASRLLGKLGIRRRQERPKTLAEYAAAKRAARVPA